MSVRSRPQSCHDERGLMLSEASAPQSIILHASGFAFDALADGPESGPLILLLHGFPQFADSWALVMQPLASAGYRVVAVNQRGYSAGARPPQIADYATANLVADAIGFADALNASQFHLVGHDWGGAVAWALAAAYPERLHTLTVLSTPHLDAFADALRNDPRQQQLSAYFLLFQAPGHAAEAALLADDASLLRGVYLDKLRATEVEANVRRFSEAGTLTAALNWYRAASLGSGHIGSIRVPTLYVWGDRDMALGEVAALATAGHVSAPYRFERLEGRSHWLIEECPEVIATLILARVRAAADV